jgi:hypothetical protein
MRLLLTLLLLVPLIGFGQYWQQQGQDIDGEAAYGGFGRVSINATGDRVAIGAPENDGNGNNSGHVRIYEWNGTSWIQQGQDIDGEAADDYSGGSVSMNATGDKVAIGATGNDGNGNLSGHARIYDWDGSSWIQLGQDIDGEAAGDYSGSVSMNAAGDRVAIGATGNDGNGSGSGHARIYDWDGSSWIQLGQDIDGEAVGDYSGSVSMNAAGDRVAIGADGNDGNGTNSGHARIYDWNGTSWAQEGQDIDGEAASDQSGGSVSMNAAGDRVAIGADGNDGNGTYAGHARIYDWDGSSWVQLGQDIDGEASYDRSGYVSMNATGDKVAIGAIRNAGNGLDAGHVRIYTWNGTSWVQLGQDIDGEAAYDFSGRVSMNAAGDRVAIGATGNDGNGNGTYAGHVRIYSCNSELTDSVIVCDSTTWMDGTTYYSSTYNPTYILGPNSRGCDSVMRLNLTVNYSNSLIDTIIACNSHTWIDGNTYTSSTNTPTYTLTNAQGCDSVFTLDLTINNNTGIDNQSTCDSLTWIDSNTYTSSTNTPTYTLTNAAGCDSVVTLNLTVNTVNSSITNTTPTLTADATGATYQWLDCNNNYAPIPGETNQSYTATANGSYAVEVTQNGCVDTSACEQVNNVGINEINSSITLHPNPTTGIVELQGINGSFKVNVYDYAGKYLMSTSRSTIDLSDYPSGIYFLKVAYGDKTEELRVVKE